MGPQDTDKHPTDPRLFRRVLVPPGPDDVWLECEEAAVPEEDRVDWIADACQGCEGWGIECWAWWMKRLTTKSAD